MTTTNAGLGGTRVGTVLGAAAIALVGLAAGPVAAAPPSPVTGTIDLADTSARGAGGIAYGQSVAFVTTVSGRLASKGYVYVTVVCTQGSTVVYQWSAERSFSFPLVDQEGQGLEWDGQAADCSATLIYRVDGQKPTIQWLDQERFSTAGGA